MKFQKISEKNYGKNVFDRIFFVLSVVFFVLPPFFSGKLPEGTFEAVYPPSVFLNFFAALFIFFYYWRRIFLINSTKKNIFTIHSVILFTTGMIFVLSALFTFLEMKNFFPESFLSNREIIFPKNSGIKIANCISGTFFASFFEEIFYRFYLPESFHTIFPFSSRPKFRFFLTELLCILIFAFSHFSNGMENVIFAFFCGIIFRICVKKTNTIIPSAIIHGFYNLISILL